jgi:DNA-directed RNA polymerase sigma subunit (sigma70/sigma32)
VTRERIRQIEAKALKKLQLKDFAAPANDWDNL